MSGVKQPVYAVLPAGGTGQRFTSSIPKQYTQLNGQPLILYTLSVLHRISWIRKIYLAIADDWVEFVQNMIDRQSFCKVELVRGGLTRHSSIRNCVNAITASLRLEGENGLSNEDPIVIVHDAVRPFVKEETYCDVVKAAAEHQASGCVCDLVATVLSATEDGFLDQALKRSDHCASNTPQAFSYQVLKMAYENISDLDLAKGTECLDLAAKYSGVKAKLVPAPDEVQKVTHRKDIFAAEALAREQSISAIVIDPANTSVIAEELCRKLQSKRLKIQKGDSIKDIRDGINAVVLIIDMTSDPLKNHFPSIQEAIHLLRNTDVQPTLSLLFRYHQEILESEYRHFRQFCCGLRRDGDMSSSMVHVVLWQEYQEEDESRGVSKVAELISGLVFDRNPVMSGQIFILP